MEMIPIFDHRTIVGYAKTEKQATRLLSKTLQTIPPGWEIDVRRRDNRIAKITGLPDGFVYCVRP